MEANAKAKREFEKTEKEGLREKELEDAQRDDKEKKREEKARVKRELAEAERERKGKRMEEKDRARRNRNAVIRVGLRDLTDHLAGMRSALDDMLIGLDDGAAQAEASAAEVEARSGTDSEPACGGCGSQE
jgi:hypothetical protein